MVALPNRVDRAQRIKETYPLLAVALKLGLSLTQKGHEWVTCCPFHEEKSASFSINPQKNVCKCFGCKLNLSVIDLTMRLLNVPIDEAMDWIEGQTSLPMRTASQIIQLHPPKPFAYAHGRATFHGWKQNLLTRPDEMVYLDRRGVCEWSIHKYCIGYTTQVPGLMRGRLLTIPNYGYGADGTPQFVGLEVRNLDYRDGGSEPKYKTLGSQTLYNLPILHRFKHTTVFLVETKFDAICINTALGRYCATALPAALFNETHARMLATFRRVIVIRDPGKAGEAFAAAVAKHLRNTEVLSMGDKDLGDAYTCDPDGVTDFLNELYPWGKRA